MKSMIIALAVFFASGCIPVAVSTYIASEADDRQTQVFRRAYIVQRRADGKPDSQIVSEIRQIDREWEVDLVLSGGDLLASTKPGQLSRKDCALAGPQSRKLQTKECIARRDAQRATLRAAGIEVNWR